MQNHHTSQTFGLFQDIAFVEKTVSGRLRDMFHTDFFRSCEICNRPCQLYYPRAGSGRKPHFLYYPFQKLPASLIQRAVLFDKSVVHRSVAEYSVFGKTSFLYLPGLQYSGGDGGTGFRRSSLYELLRIDRVHPELYVYTDK